MGKDVNRAGTEAVERTWSSDKDSFIFDGDGAAECGAKGGVKGGECSLVVPPAIANPAIKEDRSATLEFSRCADGCKVTFDGDSSSKMIFQCGCHTEDLHLFGPAGSGTLEDVCRSSVGTQQIIIGSTDHCKISGGIDGRSETSSKCESDAHQIGGAWAALVRDSIQIAILTRSELEITLIGDQVAIAIITGTQINITLVCDTVLIAVHSGLTLSRGRSLGKDQHTEEYTCVKGDTGEHRTSIRYGAGTGDPCVNQDFVAHDNKRRE